MDFHSLFSPYSKIMYSKNKPLAKTSIFSREKPSLIAALVAVLVLIFVIWSFGDQFSIIPIFTNYSSSPSSVDRETDPPGKTFYDDPDISYTLENPINNWDQKRNEWLRSHPTFAADARNRIFIVTGSQPEPCKNPAGDHLLLRCFKNKVDYARIHGYEIFYSNAFLNPKMRSYWAKIPLVRAAMVAHPEAEWIWWVDSDAIFTDMDFKVPLKRYSRHNFVLHGWPDQIYEKKSWVAVNAGIFLIRNCQWSMEFLDVWAGMGPQSPDYDKWGQTLRKTLKNKMFPESDDQSALVYLLLMEKEKWGDMMYVENEYSLHGYWVGVIGRIDEAHERYEKIERETAGLRRRHAEVVSERYGKMWQEHLVGTGDWNGGWRRPFVTHFTGCQPCSGENNPMYKENDCLVGMEKALNFADNQVLRSYGFWHPNLINSTVSPLPFNFPGESEELLA